MPTRRTAVRVAIVLLAEIVGPLAGAAQLGTAGALIGVAPGALIAAVFMVQADREHAELREHVETLWQDLGPTDANNMERALEELRRLSDFGRCR